MSPVTNYCKSVLGDDEIAKSVLRSVPELSNCSDTLLDMIFTYSKPVNLKAGEVLIEENLFDQWVYFLIEGHLDVVISGKNLGTTFGPMVGERCILGEPRGANLVAGEGGLVALGIEMTIIDEINRKVNDYRKNASSFKDLLRFAEENKGVSLELLTIVLNQVLSRIIKMHLTSKKTLDVLKRSRPTLNIQLQSLYSFSETIKEKDDIASQTNISVYSFSDFADIVYFELLQKQMSVYGYENFSQEEWSNQFAIDNSFHPTTEQAFHWLKDEFNLTNADLIEVCYSIFEVASKYTAAANNSISNILAISDCEMEKNEAMSEASFDQREISKESKQKIMDQLFIPFEMMLNSLTVVESTDNSGKMSQTDIDALFD